MILMTTETLFWFCFVLFCDGLNCKHLWLVIVYHVSSVISNCPILQFCTLFALSLLTCILPLTWYRVILCNVISNLTDFSHIPCLLYTHVCLSVRYITCEVIKRFATLVSLVPTQDIPVFVYLLENWTS